MLKLCLSRKRHVSKRLLAQVIGYCQSTCLAVPMGRFHLVSLYQDLNQKEGWGNSVRVKLSNKSINELRSFWQNIQRSDIGRSWFPPTRTHTMFVSLFTDASKFGWGAHFHSKYCH